MNAALRSIRSRRTVFWLILPLTLGLLGVAAVAYSSPPDGVRGAASGATVASGKTKVAPAPQVVLSGAEARCSPRRRPSTFPTWSPPGH